MKYWITGFMAYIAIVLYGDLVVAFGADVKPQERPCQTVGEFVEAIEQQVPVTRHLVLDGEELRVFIDNYNALPPPVKINPAKVLLVDLGQSILAIGFDSRGCMEGRALFPRDFFQQVYPKFLAPPA